MREGECCELNCSARAKASLAASTLEVSDIGEETTLRASEESPDSEEAHDARRSGVSIDGSGARNR